MSRTVRYPGSWPLCVTFLLGVVAVPRCEKRVITGDENRPESEKTYYKSVGNINHRSPPVLTCETGWHLSARTGTARGTAPTMIMCTVLTVDRTLGNSPLWEGLFAHSGDVRTADDAHHRTIKTELRMTPLCASYRS